VDYEDLIPKSRRRRLDDRDVLAFLAGKDSTYFPPGAQYRYSTPATLLLGIIVGAWRGCRSRFRADQNFCPVGMRASVVHVERIGHGAHVPSVFTPRCVRLAANGQSVTSATLGRGGIYTKWTT